MRSIDNIVGRKVKLAFPFKNMFGIIESIEVEESLVTYRIKSHGNRGRSFYYLGREEFKVVK